MSVAPTIGFALALTVSCCSALPGYGQAEIPLYPQSLDRQALTIPQPAPTSTTPTTERELIEEEVWAVFKEDAPTALRVVACESGFDPKAKNPKSSARGLFQILDLHQYTAAERFDPSKNIAIAYTLYQKHGWRPWRSSYNCHRAL